MLLLIAFANLTERLAIEVAMLAGLLVLVAFHVVPVNQALSGFSNEAVWLVVGMMIVAGGIRRSGLLDRLADVLTRFARGSPRRLRAGLTGAGALTGALLESTAAVTAMIPVVARTVRRLGAPARRYYTMLALGSMAGGLMTLIGTSGNIVANATLKRLGVAPLGFFELFPLGLAFFVVAVAYAVAARDTGTDGTGFLDVRQYAGEVMVPDQSPLAGRALLDLPLFRHYGISVLEITRGTRRFEPPASERLCVGDRLLVTAPASEHLRWGDLGGLKAVLPEEAVDDTERLADRATEVMLSPGSPWLGRTAVELRLRQQGVELIGLWRQGASVRGRLAETRMRAGDLLLLTAGPGVLDRLERNKVAVPLRDQERLDRPITQPWRALLPLVLFLVVGISGIANLGVAALAGATLALVLGVLTPQDAYQAVEWRVAILLGAVFPVARAVSTVGLSHTAAQVLAHMVAGAPLLAVIVVFLVGALFTQVLSNIATAALLTPVAVAIAGADHMRIHALVVTLLASLMMTPLTGTSNKPALLVMSQGLRHRDYLRGGIAPSLAGLVVTAILVMVLWRP
ncbi:MAG: SLC13 family permease [Clostridia bacterium]